MQSRSRWIVCLSLFVIAFSFSESARAVSVTLDVETQQGEKIADFTIAGRWASDIFEVAGSLDAEVSIVPEDPLTSTIEITGGEIFLTDFDFDFSPVGWVRTEGMVANLETVVLAAVAFDGEDTYTFEIEDADFTIVDGSATGFDAVQGWFYTKYFSTTPAKLNLDPGTTATLIVSAGSPDEFEFILEIDASGTEITGVSSAELRFSEQNISMRSRSIPEPGSAALALAALASLGLLRRGVHRPTSGPRSFRGRNAVTARNR